MREEASEDIIVWVRVFESTAVVNESEYEGRKEGRKRKKTGLLLESTVQYRYSTITSITYKYNDKPSLKLLTHSTPTSSEFHPTPINTSTLS